MGVCSCGRELSKRNVSGKCQPCSKIGNWLPGMIFNGVELIKHCGQDDKGYVIWECKCHCGEIFINKPSKIKSGRTTSCGCKHKLHCRRLGEQFSGENSPVWIVDRTKTSSYIRKYNFTRNQKGSWQYFSRKIKKVRNFTCEISGEKITEAGGLQVHHIDSITIRPDLVLDPNNVVVLKKEIHRLFHKKYGKKTTRIEWNEFLTEYYPQAA